jgi:hypothetical protein
MDHVAGGLQVPGAWLRCGITIGLRRIFDPLATLAGLALSAFALGIS